MNETVNKISVESPKKDYRVQVGERIRLKYEMQSGAYILSAGMILTVRVINNYGVAAYGDDRVLHIFQHKFYEHHSKR